MCHLLCVKEDTLERDASAIRLPQLPNNPENFDCSREFYCVCFMRLEEGYLSQTPVR